MRSEERQEPMGGLGMVLRPAAAELPGADSASD